MASMQPQLWVDGAATAVEFYTAAFGARVLHRVGEGEDIVAQLDVEGAVFWVAAADPQRRRLSPPLVNGTTGRILLVVGDPAAMHARAVAAGATPTSEVAPEHGWQVGRVADPFGHEWEIGHPL
ncbi:VOC family protein [Dactylosporangium sp. CS-047395]|uniref:VOC family protein n=1 Tax=Dactylosporangium sp. CS-047395 TaxID=3239936 RepID=UPI003D8F6CD3